MAKGAYFEELGLYLVEEEESEDPVKKITKITFSKDRPEEVAPLAKGYHRPRSGGLWALKVGPRRPIFLTEFQRLVYKAVRAIPRGRHYDLRRGCLQDRTP
jgi:hypothetical protein